MKDYSHVYRIIHASMQEDVTVHASQYRLKTYSLKKKLTVLIDQGSISFQRLT